MKYFLLLIGLIFTNFAYSQSETSLNGSKFAKIETNYGVMIFQLSDATPKHTANFIKLAKKGYFDRYNFNRVIKGFVIQGGETDSAYAAMEKEGKVLERIAPEYSPNLFHQKGALGAGRDENKEESSFLAQIYIVDGKKVTDQSLDANEKRIGNNFKYPSNVREKYLEVGGIPRLDQDYTVFGQLIKGWEVLQKITDQPTNLKDVPKVLVSMKVTILSRKEIKALSLH